MQRGTLISLAGVAALALAMPAGADWMDFDLTKPGVQSASWPQPTKLTVYLDALVAADKTNFKTGVNSIVDKLSKITVEFKDGDPPGNLTPEQKKTTVQLKKFDAQPGSPKGEAEISAFFKTGQNHGTLEGLGTIKLSNDVLGKGFGNMLKNFGVHEFGHILGLDDSTGYLNPIPPGYKRGSMMDPNFHKDSPFLAPTESDLKLLGQHYTMVPEPASLGLLALGIAGFICRHRAA